MRVMVIVKATRESEAGEAGVMLAGEGLRPSSDGKRMKLSDGERIVIDGPFAETRELIAGYWLWQVESLEQAVAWLERAPFDDGQELELRPVFKADDFGVEFTPELRAQEERLRAEVEPRNSRS